MKTKRYFSSIVVGVLSALITVFVYNHLVNNNDGYSITDDKLSSKSDSKALEVSEDSNNLHFANLPIGFSAEQLDFTIAAENTIHGVVHIKSKSIQTNQNYNPVYEWLFGDQYQREREVTGIGSGVIISKDGYIVTNYHVVENSSEIEVVLNDKRKFDAEILGTDPYTDLALLKIDAENLPMIIMGNSDNLKIGEWVLAVGNPFNLSSTVTAGIVSAKARNINIMSSRRSIESFIQTDAAVNQGNSGGALVNMAGELIGINTAILSPSGAYSGYSFAIPVNIVNKIVTDIIKYGEVQRALLGVSIQEVTADLVEENNVDKIEGVYISDVEEDGAAKDAGIKDGDIILSVDGKDVNSRAELLEQVSKYVPGDKVSIVIKRDNKKKQFDIVLRNMQGDTRIVRTDELLTELGAKFKKLDDADKKRFGLSYGLQVVELRDGILKKSGIKENFIIVNIEGDRITRIEDLKQIVTSSKNKVEVEGTYPGSKYMYIYNVELE